VILPLLVQLILFNAFVAGFLIAFTSGLLAVAKADNHELSGRFDSSKDNTV